MLVRTGTFQGPARTGRRCSRRASGSLRRSSSRRGTTSRTWRKRLDPCRGTAGEWSPCSSTTSWRRTWGATRSRGSSTGRRSPARTASVSLSGTSSVTTRGGPSTPGRATPRGSSHLRPERQWSSGMRTSAGRSGSTGCWRRSGGWTQTWCRWWSWTTTRILRSASVTLGSPSSRSVHEQRLTTVVDSSGAAQSLCWRLSIPWTLRMT
mmetsp:Transcript_70373/g.209806  ORF Transcript_70373/g.209806 Transcript_70373/m.209806 type:complete len:208 (+) Transcript_70373:216-839(+)